DLVFEHVKADRGIILLIDERNNELVPKVVRLRDADEASPVRAKAQAAAQAAAHAAGAAMLRPDAPIPVSPGLIGDGHATGANGSNGAAPQPKIHASRTI